uniref:Uncharacterized protein n=1 Tax=Lepeophtheirus salmonis TaxID=72036 RepID=A0A0K2USX0_LEPSM
MDPLFKCLGGTCVIFSIVLKKFSSSRLPTVKGDALKKLKATDPEQPNSCY